MTMEVILLPPPISYYPIFGEISGDGEAGILLSAAWEEHCRSDDPEGWFTKSREQWKRLTGLERHAQEKARKKLKSLGLLTHAKRGMPAKPYFKVNIVRLTELIDGQSNKDIAVPSLEVASEAQADDGTSSPSGDGGSQVSNE
jgi:hypothetical protein